MYFCGSQELLLLLLFLWLPLLREEEKEDRRKLIKQLRKNWFNHKFPQSPNYKQTEFHP